MSKKIETSIEFWENIIKKRNFDEKGYDLNATKYIKDKLGLLEGRTILVGLKSKEKKSESIELEEFIKVFFESIEDFSNMMTDLLNMFEEIFVKQTDKNLDIEFDFDKGKNPTTVNLEEFKEYTLILKDIKKEYEIPNLNEDELWELLDIVSQSYYVCPPNVYCEINTNISVEDWIDSYENNKQWFSFLPDLNIDNNSPLYIVFIIWKNFVNELKQYNLNYTELKDMLFKTSDKYHSLVSNRWVQSIVTSLCYLSENPDKDELLDVEEKLNDFFENTSIKKITIDEKIEKFEEFLKLPFWDKRYELYSVWVFSLIYRATKEYGLIVHTVNNKLVFPFKETHLATIACSQGNILIFSEKRTLLSNPVGKSRTKNIQPDYSFYREPITDIGSSILEIECKQYKRQSTDNFARALIDYSNGRNNADIYVVNYGDVNKEKIFKKIDELAVNGIANNKNRCDVIGKLKPKNNENILMKVIQDKIFEYGCINHSFIFQTSFQVELYWEKPLRDLDLYLEFTQHNNKELIYYNNTKIDNIFLNKDVREGSIEPEIITVNPISKGLYSFFVHNLSSDKFDKNVVCKIVGSDKVYMELRPSSLEGNYWRLFDIDTERGNFTLIDEVSKIAEEKIKRELLNHEE